MAEDIDAVYTWVDGSDPAFRAAFRRHAGAMPHRYRDNGELRCSLRSLWRHAAWVRRVHILTNGQAPRWLDCSHPRIRLVPHAAVFPDADCLPTFNSHAIETCLHRIPDLSGRFLYWNDDFFLCRDVRREDFFTPEGGQKVFADDFPLHSGANLASARERACAFTQTLLDERWGEPASPRLLPSHAPQAYDRDVLSRLESMFAEEFQATRRHRFRSGDDVALNVLYAYALLECPAERGPHRLEVLPDRSREYRFTMIEKRYLRTMHHFARILWERPRFLCVNDDLEGVAAHHPLVLGLRVFHALHYYRRAPWERQTFSRYRSSQ